MKRIVIFGATSAIAAEVAKCFAAEGAKFFLVGRNADKLQLLAQDLVVRGGTANLQVCDLADVSTHEGIIQQTIASLGDVDLALIAYGSLPNQAECQASYSVTSKELQTNFLGPISLLTLLANYFETKGTGTIAAISSVAGDRGRQSNYVYGAAKGGLSVFLSGLRNRLQHTGVRVVTIKPGFVDTPMTAQFPKGPLFASAERVGTVIHKALSDGSRDVVYVPGFWRLIMAIITAIPEAIFKRLRL